MCLEKNAMQERMALLLWIQPYKAIKYRSRLRNKFLKSRTETSRNAYAKHRNYYVGLFQEEKIKIYNNLNLNLITDNKNCGNRLNLFSDVVKELDIDRGLHTEPMSDTCNPTNKAIMKYKNHPNILSILIKWRR